MKNKLKITVDGKSFTLVGEESEEHMKEVAAYIDEKMKEVRRNASAVAVDSGLAYILTSINVADAYIKNLKHCEDLEKTLKDTTYALEKARAEADELRKQVPPADWRKEMRELEEKLETSEKEKRQAENRLDDYRLAMDSPRQVPMGHTAKNKARRA